MVWAAGYWIQTLVKSKRFIGLSTASCSLAEQTASRAKYEIGVTGTSAATAASMLLYAVTRAVGSSVLLACRSAALTVWLF